MIGLLCAIVLKQAGHDVRVIEQDVDIRQSHMAGICLGTDCQKLLQEHDRICEHLSLDSEVLKPPIMASEFVIFFFRSKA
jgi:2-polyprenyl-6-methoxyphenol hydroxylase-like FAD-dependent oxidoreductase